MKAKIIQDLLNTTDLIFRITDERQEYETYCQKEGVAGILIQLNNAFQYDEIGNKINNYQIEFFGRNADFETFREAVEALPNNELIDDFYLFTQKPTFDEFEENGGELIFSARLSLQIVEVIGSVAGRTTTIKINGNFIDFKGLLYRQDKSLLPHEAFGKNREVNLVSELLTLILPVNNTTNFLLISGVDNTYNESFLLEWQIGGVTKTFDAVLRVNVIEYSYTHEPIVFKATFERALPRTAWQISVFEKENYFYIDKEAKAYNFKIDIDFDNESDFLDYLTEEHADKLSEIGYVIAAGTQVSQDWSVLLGSPSSNENLFVYNASLTVDVGEAVWDDESAIEFAKAHKGEITQQNYVFRIRRSNAEFISFAGPYNIPAEPPLDWIYVGEFLGDGTLATAEAYIRANVNPNRGKANLSYFYIVDTSINKVFTFASSYGGYGYSYWFLNLDDMLTNYHYATVTASGVFGEYKNVPIIDYVHKASVELTTVGRSNVVKAKPLSYSNGFSVLFLLNSITQAFVDDLYERQENKYKFKFSIGLKEYEYENMIIQEAERQNNENANQVIQVAFVEGE